MTGSRSRAGTWALGFADGLLLGFLGVAFFIPGLIGLVLLIAVSYAVFRSVPLISGMLVGAGAVVGGLMLRQILLICAEPNRAHTACPPGGLAIAATFGAGVLIVGLLLSGNSIRRGALDD